MTDDYKELQRNVGFSSKHCLGLSMSELGGSSQWKLWEGRLTWEHLRSTGNLTGGLSVIILTDYIVVY